jgi:hypothetical protein
LRVLWIATKAPWPPADGGRLLLAESLAALASHRAADASQIEVTLVAPVLPHEQLATEEALHAVCRPLLVATRPRPRALAAVAATLSGKPYSVSRHARAAVARVVARELDAGESSGGRGYDVVVAEQLQAFAQSAPAVVAGVARILRAQNVESDLWRQLGCASQGVARRLLLREAARLEQAERAAVLAADATLALSFADGEKLRTLGSPSARVDVLAPPFPGELAGATQELEGAPALVLFGSAGWEPNRRGERRFVDEFWPQVRSSSPGAVLHWFGGEESRRDLPGVRVRKKPRTSADVFSPGAVLLLPLEIASGVRMRVLEAWARGVVVVASPAAASGLAAEDGRDLLLARSGEEFAAAIARLATVPGLSGRLIAGGRARLASDHAPERFAASFAALASELASRAGPAGR